MNLKKVWRRYLSDQSKKKKTSGNQIELDSNPRTNKKPLSGA